MYSVCVVNFSEPAVAVIEVCGGFFSRFRLFLIVYFLPLTWGKNDAAWARGCCNDDTRLETVTGTWGQQVSKV